MSDDEDDPWDRRILEDVAGLMDRLPERFHQVMDLLPGLWMLDEKHQPVKAKSWREWATWMGTVGHHVAYDQVGDVTVSSIFLTSSPHPLLPLGQFETMILGGPLDGYQHRCATWDEAVAEHQAALVLARAKQLH